MISLKIRLLNRLNYHMAFRLKLFKINLKLVKANLLNSLLNDALRRDLSIGFKAGDQCKPFTAIITNFNVFLPF
jgi:hypothetical protein